MPLLSLGPNLVGKVLLKPIYGSAGQILLTEGVILTPKYIKLLKSKGITFLYAGDSHSSDIEITDAVKDYTRSRATAILRNVASNLYRTGTLQISETHAIVEQLVEDIDSNTSVVVCISTLRQKDNYTFEHSVNVCVLSLLIGKKLHLARTDMKILGMGTLLHDIGKMAIPTSILNKPSKLKPKEYEQIKNHTWEGFKILVGRVGISAVVAHISLNHHERLDGSGYPRNLKGDQIHMFSRIAAISDVYDAVTSDRVYHTRMQPHAAQDLLLNSAMKGKLDGELVNALVKSIARYPNGSLVVLNTGQIGIVAKQNETDSARPFIKVISDARFESVAPYLIDLVQARDIYVAEVIYDYPEPLQASAREA